MSDKKAKILTIPKVSAQVLPIDYEEQLNPPPKKETRGRKKKRFDLNRVFEYSICNPTLAELATVLQTTAATVKARYNDDEAFKNAVDAGRAAGKYNIRRKQYEKALEGDKSMLIWWGKQNLDQAEIQKQRISGSEEGSPIAINNFAELARAVASMGKASNEDD